MWHGQGIGYGQTWTDVSFTRAIGVTYTNLTGKPITAIVSVIGTTVASSAIGIMPYVNGYSLVRSEQYSPNASGYRVTTTFVVPPNSTYRGIM